MGKFIRTESGKFINIDQIVYISINRFGWCEVGCTNDVEYTIDDKEEGLELYSRLTGIDYRQ